MKLPKFFLLAWPVMMLVLSCSLTGNVYVTVRWVNVTDMPASITHDLLGVPANVASITPGAYYLVNAGASYFFTATYGVTDYTLTPVVLTAKRTVMGLENTYYDLVCFQDQIPSLYPVPAN